MPCRRMCTRSGARPTIRWHNETALLVMFWLCQIWVHSLMRCPSHACMQWHLQTALVLQEASGGRALKGVTVQKRAGRLVGGLTPARDWISSLSTKTRNTTPSICRPC